MPTPTILAGQSQTGGVIGAMLSGQAPEDMGSTVAQTNPIISSYGYGSSDNGFYGHMTVPKCRTNEPEVIGNDGKAFFKIIKEDKGFPHASRNSRGPGKQDAL